MTPTENDGVTACAATRVIDDAAQVVSETMLMWLKRLSSMR